jgi:quinohemoprotein ethanol dehydrogenase
LGNLILTTPGDKPYKAKSLGADAALVYTSDLLNILPGLPPFIGDAVKALPVYDRIVANKDNSFLRAIDPLTGNTVWSVPATSWQDRAGVLTTGGGLVFHGDAAGVLSIYDTETGERLSTIDTGTSIMAAPMSYTINGEQYIAVLAGWGGGGWPYVPRSAAAYNHDNTGRVLVFKLNGVEVPKPAALPALTVAPEPPPMPEGADPDRGAALFMSQCPLCHAMQQRTQAADLRRMEKEIHENFERIVLEGMFVSLGMPRWDDIFTPAEVRDIHAYLIREQQKVRQHELMLQEKGLPLDAVNSGVLSSY